MMFASLKSAAGRRPGAGRACGTHGAGPLTLEKRTKLYSEGETANGIWEVIEGSVILFKTLADGRRQITEVAGPGALLGSPASAVYSCSAKTLTRTSVRHHGSCAIQGSPHLKERLASHALRRVEALQDHALLLGRKSALERIASFLLSLPSLSIPSARTASSLDADAFTIAFGQRDIGDYLGLKVETVCRILTKLKRSMIIATGKRGQFRLLDSEALRAIASVK